jgi:hypothetical protein
MDRVNDYHFALSSARHLHGQSVVAQVFLLSKATCPQI